MKMDDMIMISVDDHIIEPPDMFERHAPAALRDKAPKVVIAKGEQCWSFEDEVLPTRFGLNAVAGRRREEYGMEPTAYAQLRRGCYDIHARVGDMNANGTLGSLCFPTFTKVAGEVWLEAKDKNLARIMIEAYNDWHYHDWCNTYPGRFIPLATVPAWDAQLCANEVRRVARMGFKAITFSQNPSALGLPSFHSGAWDPMWKACCDENIVVAIHFGAGGGMRFQSSDSPIDTGITTMALGMADCVTDLVYSPILRSFPTLKIALSEAGVGWLPFLMERADFVYEHHHQWTNQDFGGLKPSDLIRRHMLSCFIADQYGLANRHTLGVEMITWECDYPHSDSTWPESPEAMWPTFQTLPDDELDQITHLNAMKFFNYDPFKVLDRKDCTVGALRAKARADGVDLTPMQGRGGRDAASQGPRRPVTAEDVRKQLNPGVVTAGAR